VVRRILVQKMRLLASRTGERPPSDAELAAFYAEHREDYRPPDRITFWHVFAHRGAEAVLARARAEAPADAVLHGDSFAFPARRRAVGGAGGEGLRRGLAQTVVRAETGVDRPLPSPYLHLVWVETREPGTPPPLAAVRERLVERWQDEQRGLRVTAMLRGLERRYPLRVESAAWRGRRAS
jgi:hypothetical protein